MSLSPRLLLSFPLLRDGSLSALYNCVPQQSCRRFLISCAESVHALPERIFQVPEHEQRRCVPGHAFTTSKFLHAGFLVFGDWVFDSGELGDFRHRIEGSSVIDTLSFFSHFFGSFPEICETNPFFALIFFWRKISFEVMKLF